MLHARASAYRPLPERERGTLLFIPKNEDFASEEIDEQDEDDCDRFGNEIAVIAEQRNEKSRMIEKRYENLV